MDLTFEHHVYRETTVEARGGLHVALNQKIIIISFQKELKEIPSKNANQFFYQNDNLLSHQDHSTLLSA